MTRVTETLEADYSRSKERLTPHPRRKRSRRPSSARLNKSDDRSRRVDLDEQCKRYQKEFELKVQSTQWKKSMRYLEVIAQNMRFDRELQEVKTQREHDNEAISSISSIPVEAIHNKLYRKQQHSVQDNDEVSDEYHCPKDWFLDDAKKWIDKKDGTRIFWLYGKYGMGKTSSVSRVVHFLRESISETDSVAVDGSEQQFAYFFISRNTAEEIIRSLVSQLARGSNGFLVPSLNLSPSKLSTQTIEWYRKKLKNLIKSKKTILILDGLDECSDTSELLNYLSKEILRYFATSALSRNHRNISDETPLMRAATEGSLESVRTLLELGATVSVRNINGDTVIHCAVRRSKLTKKVLELLIGKEADINAQNDKGETALHIALDSNTFSNDAICALLLANASTSIKNAKGETPLSIKDRDGRCAIHHVASKGSPERVKLLLEHGASIDSSDKRGWTPLCVAANSRNFAIMKALLEQDKEKGTINAQLTDGRTALHISAMKGDFPAIELLLTFGAAINLTDKEKRTPLRRAVGLGHQKAVRLLLEKGADCKSTDKTGQTPLHRAVTFGLTEVARMLLDYEAPLNLKDTYSRTPAMLSVQSGKASTILLLLEHKAEGFPKLEPYKSDPAQSESVDLDERMKQFVMIGQFWKVVTGEDISKFEEFISNKQTELEWILKARCEMGASALHLASRNDRVEVIKALVDRFHIPVDDPTDDGFTPLHSTAKRSKINATITLIAMGANVNATNNYGATPLHQAATFGEPEIVKRLLDCENINPNVEDRYLQTPLIYAIRNEKVENAKLLLERDDIIIDVKNHKGRMALHYAKDLKSKKPELEKMILEAMDRQCGNEAGV
ncbi:hypothetical protein B7463_g4759, partial [Scytalidium lignicola]